MRLWQYRWLARASAINWSESLGYLLMTGALQQFSIENTGAKTFDAFVPSPTAEAILTEIDTILQGGPSKIVAPGGRSPSIDGLTRQLWEKRGLFRLAAGDYVAAEEAFKLALAAQPDSLRTQVKVGLSLALTTYLWGLGNAPAKSTTRSLADEARLAGFTDLLSQALANIEAMEKGSRAVRPYDIL